MPTKTESLQKIFRDYEREHGHAPARLRDAVTWGHGQGRIELPDVDPFEILADEMARALRQEYAVDDHGRRYRVNHAVHITKGGVQYTFWAKMGYAPRAHMQRAFSLRREQIVSDCVQLKTDIDAFNGMNAAEQPIQLVLDFAADVEERMAVSMGAHSKAQDAA